MFYDIFKELCDEKGISVSRAATEIGLSNSTPTKWKKTGAMPDSNTLAKIAVYFNVSVAYLMGGEKEKAPSETGEGEVTDRQIKAAFFRGTDLTEEEMDAAWDDVLDLRDIVIRRKRRDAGDK